MSEVVLFHHVQGLTDGVRVVRRATAAGRSHRAHAGCLRRTDLRDARGGNGLRARDRIRRARRARSRRRLGVPRARGLRGHLLRSDGRATTRADARRAPAARCSSRPVCPFSEFGEAWPAGVPVQVHGKEGDEFFDEDLGAARALVASTDDAELFLYPGEEHLFTDASLPAYDADATAILIERVLSFLGRS